MARLALVALLTLVCARMLEAQVQVGDDAPELAIAERIRWPAGAPVNLAELRGRWVVIDFFAPWCPGCLASVKHINELASALDEKQMVFIRMCDASKEIMESMQTRVPLMTWVALDDQGKTSNAYSVGGHPSWC